MRAAIPLLLLLTAACASTGGAGPPPTRTSETRLESGSGTLYTVESIHRGNLERVILDAPRDRAFEAMASAYHALGLEITGADQANGALLVGNQRARGRLAGQGLGSFFDCGTGPAGPVTTTYTLQVTIRGQVTPAEGGTLLETRVEANARDAGTSNPPVACASKGTLEQRIADEVRQRLGA